MASETTILKNLEQLRNWQIEQQTKLFKYQQEQREKLNIEQKNAIKALGLSIEDIEENTNLADTSAQNRSDSDEEQKVITVKGSKLKAPVLNSTEKVECLNKNHPVEKMECIDNIPIPSIKKDFKTLLDEKLNDSEALEANHKVENKNKKPFLKKGDGLLRFGMHLKKNDKKTRNFTFQKASSSNLRKENIKNKKVSKGSHDSRMPKVPLKKLNLKDVSLPAKKPQRSSSTVASVPQEIVEVPTIFNEKNETDESNRSDMDATRLETEMFELLEKQADNSSFCSTSSTVLTFMQQSTPLQLKNIRKNLQLYHKILEVGSAANSNDMLDENMHLGTALTFDKNLQGSTSQNKIHEDNIPNDIQELLVTKSLHNNDNQIANRNSIKNNKQYEDYISNADESCDQSSCSEASEFTIEKCRSFDDTSIDCPEVYQKADANISVRVRFSEHNEYKSLTDISSISSDSYNYQNKRSSKCSIDIESLNTPGLIDRPDIVNQTNLSDIDESNQSGETCTSVKSNQNIYSNFINSDLHHQNLNNEQFSLSDISYSDLDGKFHNQDTDLEFQKSIKQALKWNDSKIIAENYEEIKNLSKDICESKQQLPISNNVDETILKSELLKNRLLELEREIDIFKRENFALTSQRQKLHDDHDQLQKEFQDKYKNLEKEKIRIDNIFQEEKKKLAQEKVVLENRYKYAKKKLLQTKQEREEVQKLKEELEKLHKDMSEKENRWQAAQARQRSQLRVLQMENVKLKEEIVKFNALKKNERKYERPVSVSDTKAIHEINKHLDDQRNINKIHSKREEKKSKTTEQNSKSSTNSSTEKIESASPTNELTMKTSTEEMIINDAAEMIINQKKQANLLKKRCLYESLLKDAINDNTNSCDSIDQYKTVNGNIENTSSNFSDDKSDENNKVLINDRLKYNQLNADKSFSTDSEPDLIIIPTDKKLEQTRLAKNKNSKNVQSSYKQFVQDVINPKAEEKLGFNSNQDSTSTNSPIISLKPNDSVNFCLNSSKEPRKPLPLPIKRTFLNSESNKTNPVSESNINDECTLDDTQQITRKVEHFDDHIEYWYSNGNVKRVYPERNVSKMIYYNGDVCETTADSCIKYFYAATKTWQTTYPDGFEILEFPDGQQERRTADGVVEVSFPDGSVRLIQPNGIEKWILSNGIIAVTFPNGDKTLSFPNGQREIHTSDFKSREYPDGTVKFIYLDGAQKTRYSNGRIRMKDRDGNVIMDTY